MRSTTESVAETATWTAVDPELNSRRESGPATGPAFRKQWFSGDSLVKSQLKPRLISTMLVSTCALGRGCIAVVSQDCEEKDVHMYFDE